MGMLSETPVNSFGMAEGLLRVCLAPEVVVDPFGPSALGDTPDRVLTGLRFFGDYELPGQIGRGGCGVVFKAQQPRAHESTK